VAFESSQDNDKQEEKDVLLSLEEYEKEYGKNDIIALVTESELTDEAYFSEGSLIVKGKLKGIKGVAFTVGEAPCMVYELEVTDTIVNNTAKKYKTVNLAISEMIIHYVEDKLQMDQESVFYLKHSVEPFTHLKEDYYGLISTTRAIVPFSGDKESYKQLKKNLREKKKDFDNRNRKIEKNR
jgi:hypothetical protein